jgi:hypothetical protein
VQILVLGKLIEPVGIRNLLFEEECLPRQNQIQSEQSQAGKEPGPIQSQWLIRNMLYERGCDTSQDSMLPLISVSKDHLKPLIMRSMKNELRKYFFQMFIMICVIAVFLRKIYLHHKIRSEEKKSLTGNVLVWSNLIFFMPLILLVPINWGRLLFQPLYPEVGLSFKAEERIGVGRMPIDSWPLELVKPIPKQIIQKRIPLKRDLLASPALFHVDDGETLTFTARPDNPAITSAQIDGSILTLTPKSLGTTTIEVTAEDSDGRTVERSFTVESTGRSTRKPKRIGSIGTIRSNIGWPRDPVVLNLLEYFEDPESGMLSFTASSSDNNIAVPVIADKFLMIIPISSGDAIITINIYDGQGGSLTKEIQVVCEQRKRDRMVVIDQQGDVYYLYSRIEKRIWVVDKSEIAAIAYYGLVPIF